MPKLEQTLTGDFDQLLSKIVDGILSGSKSAFLKDSSDFRGNTSRCSVRVFERYSMSGATRVSLNITLFQADGEIRLSAISSGGSQAVLRKVTAPGEEAFLDKLKEIL